MISPCFGLILVSLLIFSDIYWSLRYLLPQINWLYCLLDLFFSIKLFCIFIVFRNSIYIIDTLAVVYFANIFCFSTLSLVSTLLMLTFFDTEILIVMCKIIYQYFLLHFYSVLPFKNSALDRYHKYTHPYIFLKT